MLLCLFLLTELGAGRITIIRLGVISLIRGFLLKWKFIIDNFNLLWVVFIYYNIYQSEMFSQY